MSFHKKEPSTSNNTPNTPSSPSTRCQYNDKIANEQEEILIPHGSDPHSPGGVGGGGGDFLHHRGGSSMANGSSSVTDDRVSIMDSAQTTTPATITSTTTQMPRQKLKKKTSNEGTVIRTKSSRRGGKKSQFTNEDESNDKKKKKEHHAIIKYGSLLLLVGQMVGLVLLMRYSRTHPSSTSSSSDGGGDLYLASTAVFMMEIMKFLLCCTVVFHQTNSSLTNLKSEILTHVCHSPNEMIKLCIPSFLYTLQNNLLYLALSNLDAATYQILYQLKILSTAIFSATMLGRRFSKTKWMSLVVLTVGVAVVQVSGSSDHSSGSNRSNDKSNGSDDTTEEGNNRFVGLVAVLCAACTSGFSGVYFEKILKGSETSLWIRNIQMGIPSMIIALLTVFIEDSEEVERKGFFVGYNLMVVLVITVQAVGGLIVAVVVKYADNVLKVFATSFSILLSCLISALVFDFRPNWMFLVGAFLVILSTAMYSMPEKKVGGLAKRGHVLPISHGTRKSVL